MKHLLILAAVSNTFMGPLFSQETTDANPESVGILPAARQGSTISDGETSPFGLPTQKKEVTVNRTEYSQEDTIRDILRNLRVTGVVDNGKRVLLGDMIIEQGHFLADVIPGQTERVICKEITDQYIDVEFVDLRGLSRTKKREERIPIDLKTQVGIQLKGCQNGMTIARLGKEELPIAFEPEPQP